jgi:glycosyltransferase involved in cell wall biosynthesis
MSQVDVIVPCYNYGCFLRRCVESVLTQEGVDVRVLIIDDASPDNTAEVAAALVAGDSRVSFRRHAANRGHIATYNEGLEWAQGDYLLLLSADDLLAPGALARAVRVMDVRPEVGFTCGKAIDFTGEPPARGAYPAGEGNCKVLTGGEFLETTCGRGGNTVFTPTVVVRTALQHRVGGYRADLPHTGDMEMWMRLAADSSVAVLDAVQAFYRVHGGNMHLRIAGTQLRELKHRWAAFETFFREHGSTVEGAQQLRQMAGRNIAEEAMWEAYSGPYDRDRAGCSALRSLAERADPDIRSSRIYRRLRWKLRLGPGLWYLLRRLAFRKRIEGREGMARR